MSYEIIADEERALLKRLEKMLEEAEKMTPEQLYDMGLREIETPHGTLTYWVHGIFI